MNSGIRYSPKLIVGVDIDKELVGCAMVNKRLTYSLSKPTSMSTSTLKSDGDDDIIVRDYFLQSIPAMFGLLPVKSFDDIDFNNDQVKFPDSVQFRCCDWMEEPHSYNKYDTILGLSVSKWIHLNRGDKGLQEFFQRIYDNLRIGGRFIFEPQAWKSYRKYKDLSKEAQLDISPALQQQFATMYEILEAIKFQELEPALSWAKSNREGLEKRGSSLEFQLHRLRYIQFLIDQQHNEALMYAKNNFNYFNNRHLHDYCNTCGNGGQLMCCDSCPRAFHFTCLVPPLDIDNTPQGNWYCRVCCAEENPPSGPQGLFQELIERINNPINENNDNELINGGKI
ncbi:21120_t:CDS:2 [Entrophospora sp. SA101]|nr:21120_t:CDS:2 [Entrophospora sp. SA101]